jgi:hypothetical protein
MTMSAPWRARRRFVIGVKAQVLGIVVVLVLASVLVVCEVHTSMARAFVASLLVTTALLSTYFTILLWCGMRPDNGSIAWQDALSRLARRLEVNDLSGADIPTPTTIDLPLDDHWGLLLGLLWNLALWIGFSVLMATLLWLGVNLALIALVVLATPLYAIFRRGLRLVLIHGARCRGRLAASLLQALPYAFGYSLLICSLLVLLDDLVHRLMPGVHGIPRH